MSSDLSPELNQLIAQQLALGHYSCEDELLTEAVQLLSQRKTLRSHIAAGTQQLAAGEFTDYHSHSMRQRFDDLKAGNYFDIGRAPRSQIRIVL
jgi:hypothetical protein